MEPSHANVWMKARELGDIRPGRTNSCFEAIAKRNTHALLCEDSMHQACSTGRMRETVRCRPAIRRLPAARPVPARGVLRGCQLSIHAVHVEGFRLRTRRLIDMKQVIRIMSECRYMPMNECHPPIETWKYTRPDSLSSSKL